MAEIEEEKVFEHYLKFPEEVRMVVINEMSTEDRCRFTRCSSLSQKEAQKCKNYIYGMKFYASKTYTILHVLFSKKYKNEHSGDYTVRFFLDYDRKTYITYTIPPGVELWRNQLDRSINLMQYACEYVKDMLNTHQNKIKMLSFMGVENYDFGISSLPNLESLKLDNETNIRQFISKIRKPLKELECESPISEDIAVHYEQIYKVQDLFKVRNIQMNYERFQKISANKMYIDIGILAEEDICDFIKCWQNDKIRKSFQHCEWFTIGSNFDIQKFLRLLKINRNVKKRQPWTKIDIRHNTDAGKKAELCFRPFSLEIRVINQ